MNRGGSKPTRKDRIMERERCDNCLYEYACDWRKAGEELRCEDWKPEDVRMEGDANEQSKR